jgi:tRNA pseudouridine(55) synthase
MNEISKDELIRGLLDATALGGDLEGEQRGELKGIIPVYKEWGKTPLEVLEQLRTKYPVLEGVPLSYVGRLDPLAEGLMLVLVGETNKDREKYLGLDKTYEVEILFGVKTDTGDLFGVPAIDCIGDTLKSSSNNSKDSLNENAQEKLTNDVSVVLKAFVGKQQFPYPVYSSKTVQGKPLFQWMNEGKIDEIEIPKKDVEIYSLELLSVSSVRGSEILEKVELALNTVKGDFRYGEIRAGWNEILKDKNNVDFVVVKIQCECSSGTYMRVLAEEIGKKMEASKEGKVNADAQEGIPALAYSIKRTKVGDVGLESAI